MRLNADNASIRADIEDAIDKFDEQYMKRVNDLDEIYNVTEVITFNGSKGNFRKKITPTYKANRKGQEKWIMDLPVDWKIAFVDTEKSDSCKISLHFY